MPIISLHVIDVSRAIPAAGMKVEIFHEGSSTNPLAAGALDQQGVLECNAPIAPGIYEAMIHIGDYYRGQGVNLPDPAFLEDVPFRFGIAAGEDHYHLPMKMTPWGFSLFRGA